MTNLHRMRPYAWALGLLWLLPAAGFTTWILTAPDHNSDGQCEGIGFGCTLTPRDGAAFLATMSAPLLVFLGLVVCAVIAEKRRLSRLRQQRSSGTTPSGPGQRHLTPSPATSRPDH